MRIKLARGGVVTLCVLLGACQSLPTTITTTPKENVRSLGQAEGRACGSLGLLGTAYYFVPMGLNSRVEEAYQRALASKPGATALVNVTMQESWFWWVLGTARCVTIKGEAVQ